jgi:hypothetical protein
MSHVPVRVHTADERKRRRPSSWLQPHRVSGNREDFRSGTSKHAAWAERRRVAGHSSQVRRDMRARLGGLLIANLHRRVGHVIKPPRVRI